mmetsp:Transcript_600/g.1544  ORF Transcript_600/g.1544 Transcript_600/m.1544 type:complete len:124 (-) Transcript_600:2281-2652(-)
MTRTGMEEEEEEPVKDYRRANMQETIVQLEQQKSDLEIAIIQLGYKKAFGKSTIFVWTKWTIFFRKTLVFVYKTPILIQKPTVTRKMTTMMLVKRRALRRLIKSLETIPSSTFVKKTIVSGMQ